MSPSEDVEYDGGVKLHDDDPEELPDAECSSPESEATIVPYKFSNFTFPPLEDQQAGYSHALLDPEASDFKPATVTARPRRSSTVDSWKTAKTHMSPSKKDPNPQPVSLMKRLEEISLLPMIPAPGSLHQAQDSVSSTSTATTPTTPRIMINGLDPAYSAPEALHFRNTSDSILDFTTTRGLRQIIHNRTITDPFIDRTPIPPSPAFSSPSPVPPKPIIDFKTFLAHRASTSRLDLPIPPPSLPCAKNLVHSAEAQQRLDSQKAARESWIRTQAKTIANLATARAIAEQNWRQRGRPEDLRAWNAATAAFEDATNLDKRMEERRALFMPGGMRPLRTGEGSWLKDGVGGVLATGEMMGEDSGKGRLLGFNMAIMERVCVDVLARGGDARDDFVEEMSADDKRAVRRDCVRILQRGTQRRLERMAG